MKRVLIIDDSKFERSILRKFLEGDQFEVVETDDGLESLKILEEQKVDVVLLDLLMPKVSGLETLRMIREKFSQLELPIIILSLLEDYDTVSKAISLGANEYVHKPIDFKLLKLRIEVHMRIHDLLIKSLELEKLKGLATMVATYNHELLNPLTIAMFLAEQIETHQVSEKEKLKEVHLRLSKIIKKMSEILDSENLTFEQYHSRDMVIKLD